MAATNGPTESFGQWLKSRREERGMSLRDVERVTNGGLSNAALSQIETGKIKNPSIRYVLLISAALGLSDDEVLSRARNGYAPAAAPDFCPHCGQMMRPERVEF